MLVGGCEVGFVFFDLCGDGIVWIGCYDGIFECYDGKIDILCDVSVWLLVIESWVVVDFEYCFQWNYFLVILLYDFDVVFIGLQYVYCMCDGGFSWECISFDLMMVDLELMC